MKKTIKDLIKALNDSLEIVSSDLIKEHERIYGSEKSKLILKTKKETIEGVLKTISDLGLDKEEVKK